MLSEPHENFEDVVEHKLFKYKYRQCNDDPQTYMRRQGRVIHRFKERAQQRDPALEQDLFDLYVQDQKDNSLGQLLLDPENYSPKAVNESRRFRDYMASEAVHQYRDYYESDTEEHGFFDAVVVDDGAHFHVIAHNEALKTEFFAQ